MRRITSRYHPEERKAAEKEKEEAKRKQDLIKKFDDTILKDLQHFFKEIALVFSSPYLEMVLDTHQKRFFIEEIEVIPAYASLP